MKALFLTSFPIEAAATRYRCAQFFPYLRRSGVECTLQTFLSRSEFNGLYRPGRTLINTSMLARAAFRRLPAIFSAKPCDVVFVQREAALFGPPVIEWFVTRLWRKQLIFDFDDAIYVRYLSPTYGRLATWLKCSGKTRTTIRMSRHVIAGNEYLARYARRLNGNVSVIPTVVDEDLYHPNVRRTPAVPTIGWIGSPTTTQYLETIVPVLEDLSRTEKFRFRVIGASRSFNLSGAPTENQPWKMEREIADFQALDIGLYPLTENDWSLGKSGFKAVQYMAAGVACVASPVGAIHEILRDGSNGLLAATPEQWRDRLSTLLRDADRRRCIAEAGFKTVAERYSLSVFSPRLLEILRTVAA
jgi:glycosyltransferase involved in cell wall biosynthesis